MQARAWHVPLGYLSYGMTLRAIVGTMITTLLSGVIAFGCFGLAPESLVQSISYEPAFVGAGTAIALLYIQLRRTPLLRGAALLVGRSREAKSEKIVSIALSTCGLLRETKRRSAHARTPHFSLSPFFLRPQPGTHFAQP